jgi:hypothetical protein
MCPTLSSRATFHSRGPPSEGVELPSLIQREGGLTTFLPPHYKEEGVSS